jgi:signal transduction histidine kinase
LPRRGFRLRRVTDEIVARREVATQKLSCGNAVPISPGPLVPQMTPGCGKNALARFLHAVAQRRAQRRRDYIMPGSSQRRFYSTIRGPSAEALEILAPHRDHILSLWRREARAFGVEADWLLPGATFDFAHLAKQLRRVQYAALRSQLEQFGEKLAQQGVKLESAVAALNRLFEISLSHLIQEAPKRTSLVLALGRLHALAAQLIVLGYTGLWAAEGKTLAEAKLAEEERRREASAYVTRVYEQERRRLSRDLHDQIGHDLLLIKLYLELIASEQKDKTLANVQPRIAEAVALVSQAIDAVRRLVLDLGPAVLDDLGFLAAVRSYASQFSARTKIKVKLEGGHLPEDIPMSHQVALYRLLQGALSNVLKHASAQNVRVSLSARNDSALMMEVEDDGVGFDTDSRQSSFGLTAMRERVEVLGGSIKFQSTPATPAAKRHGTTIKVALPLPGGTRRELQRPQEDRSVDL